MKLKNAWNEIAYNPLTVFSHNNILNTLFFHEKWGFICMAMSRKNRKILLKKFFLLKKKNIQRTGFKWLWLRWLWFSRRFKILLQYIYLYLSSTVHNSSGLEDEAPFFWLQTFSIKKLFQLNIMQIKSISYLVSPFHIWLMLFLSVFDLWASI